MLRKSIILGIILIVAVYIMKLVAVSISKWEFGEFKPVSVIFLLDVSASNRELFSKQVQTILKISKRLDSEDHALIYVVSEDAYNVYNDNPHKLTTIREAIQKRGAFDSKAFGTAYGLALKKAVGDALRFKAEGYTPAIIVLGDLENEGDITKQINWSILPKNINNTKKYIPELCLTFLYAHPQKLDDVRQTLMPVMDEGHLIVASDENVDLAVKKLLETLGR